MSVWAYIIAAALAINGALFGAAFLLRKFLARRAAVARQVEYRALFAKGTLPPPGAKVQLLTEDEQGSLDESGACHWPYLGWSDAVTLLPVEGKIIGWRWHPFEEARPAWSDLAARPREMVDEQLARLFPDEGPRRPPR